MRLHYTLLLSITHARISLSHALVEATKKKKKKEEEGIRKECGNEPVSRIKMADYRALVSMGAL